MPARNLYGVVPVPTQGQCAYQWKYRYRTRRLALQALALNRKTGGHAESVYKCPICRDWHMTSQKAA